MNKVLKQPLSSPDMKFIAESIAKSSYKALKPEKTQSAKDKQDSKLNPSYNGQYNSEYYKKFDQKHLNKCPTKEVLEEVIKSTQF